MQCIPCSKPVAAAVVLCLGFSCAYADETVLKEVVVTASLGKNLLDVAQPASVLSGDDLARQLAGSLGETLSRQLGVSSTYFGSTASRPVLRGLGGYRVQTLQDGIATLDVGNLSDDHAVTLDPSLAEQIEILKGPATLLYGSGAAGGLINIVTRRIPSADTAAGLSGIGETRFSTVAGERANAFSLNARKSAFAVHGDVFKSKSNAIDIPGETLSPPLRAKLIAAGEPVESHNGQIPNAFSDNEGGAIGASWFASQALIGAGASRYQTTYGIPSEDEAFIDLQQDRFEGKAEWRGDGAWLKRVQLHGAYNDYTHTEFEAPGIRGTLFTQSAYEVRLAATHSNHEQRRGTFGGQLTRIDFVAEGDEAFVPASITTSSGVFVVEEFDRGNWIFNVGARIEKQTIDVDILPQFENTTASFAAGAIFKPNSMDSFSANLTRTARHPQATELYAEGPHVAAQRFEVGDATLATEIATTIDLSLRRSGDESNWLVNLFYNDYENFVFADPTGNFMDSLAEVRYRQTAANLFGFEAEYWTPPADFAQGAIRFRAMSDYVRGARNGGESLPQIPPLRVGLGVHFERNRWHAEMEALRYAKQNRVAANELETDGFTMVNADVSARLGDGVEWLLFLRGTNLLDEEARQHASALKDLVPLPGRSLTVGVRASF
jgi:iron complex outermembrane recepter protein